MMGARVLTYVLLLSSYVYKIIALYIRVMYGYNTEIHRVHYSVGLTMAGPNCIII